MSDLDKMMAKLKKDKPKKEETPTEEPQEDLEEEELEDVEETSEDEDLEDAEESEPIPAQEGEVDQTVEHEVAVLQNDGVFRRELLLILKELVDVQKVFTQTLIDLKKKFDQEDGTN